MAWAPLTGVLMASNWNSPIPVLGSPSTTALYPSHFIQQRPVCWCRAHPTFCGSTSTYLLYANKQSCVTCKTPAHGLPRLGAAASGSNVRGVPHDTPAQWGHPAWTTSPVPMTSSPTPQNWKTLPCRKYLAHPRQRAVPLALKGHHRLPPWESGHPLELSTCPVRLRTPPASATHHPPRRVLSPPCIQIRQRQSKHRWPRKRPSALKRKQSQKRRKKLWSSIYQRDTVTLNAKSPLPQTWYAVHCVWFGFMSNVPARTLTTRASGVVTHAAHCPNLFRAWPNKLNF